MKNALIIAVVGGFLPQFEKNDVKILKALGFNIHYAANFDTPIYAFDKDALEEDGIVLHKIGIRKSPLKIRENLKALFAIRKTIKKEKIDFVHCHNPMGGFCGRLACLGLKEKRPYVLYTAHGFHFYNGASILNCGLYYTIERFLSRFTDGIITINREDFLRAKKFPLRISGNAHIIHSVGVDENKFYEKPGEREKIRHSLRIPKDAFHIVTAAELNSNKNQEVIIRAIGELKDTNVFFSICGSGPDYTRLKALIKDLGLESRVRLLGYRNDMERILQSADLFSFTSIREGLGIAAIEALLSGVPLICSDNRGTREYAIDGVNGIVCTTKDAKDYAKGIKMLLDNPNELLKMKKNARESAMEFTVKNVGKTMEVIYKDILSKLER